MELKYIIVLAVTIASAFYMNIVLVGMAVTPSHTAILIDQNPFVIEGEAIAASITTVLAVYTLAKIIKDSVPKR